MLDVAGKYKEQLELKFANIAFDMKYKYLYGDNWREKYKPVGNTYNSNEFVSIDKECNVLGYFKYDIYRSENSVGGLQIVNFTENKLTFGKDLKQILDDIFVKFNFRKMNYCVYIGNPIECTYDKLTKKYGGRIIGIKRAHSVLLDGKLYDLKMYELFQEDYVKHKNAIKYKFGLKVR